MKDLLFLLVGVAGGFIAATCLWLAIFEKPSKDEEEHDARM